MSHKIIVLKKKAKQLYLSGLYTQKEICKQIGVSQKSMSIWVNKYQWKEKKDSIMNIGSNPLNEYLIYLEKNYPEIHFQITQTFINYQLNINNNENRS